MTAVRQPPGAATSDLDRARALLADDPDEMDEEWLAEIIAAVRAAADSGSSASASRAGSVSIRYRAASVLAAIRSWK